MPYLLPEMIFVSHSTGLDWLQNCEIFFLVRPVK